MSLNHKNNFDRKRLENKQLLNKIITKNIKGSEKKFLLYSNEFIELAKQKKVLFSAKNYVLEKIDLLKKLPEKCIVYDKKNGIKYEKSLTGKYPGGAHELKLRATFAKKFFFIKVYPSKKAFVKEYRKYKRQFDLVEKYLQKTNYSVNGIKFKIIRPHLIYNRFIVTNFYNENEVIELLFIEDKKTKKNMNTALHQLQIDLAKNKIHPFDLGPHNAFYERSSNSILLFDLF